MKNLILGNKYLQSFFDFLHKVALKGMNYDRGHVPELSGEKYVLQYIKAFFSEKKEIVVFDVGANRGQYATLALSIFGQNSRIYAFEPSQNAFRSLSSISSQNISPFLLGLGATKQETQIYYDEEGSVRASLYPNIDYSKYQRKLSSTQTIQLTTLDDFCDEQKIKAIDFVKIDVEGHELEVLKGAKTLIESKKIKFIQFEFGIAAIESKIFLKDFFTTLKGYKIYRILQNGLQEIDYEERYEIFLTTNYLAVG